MFIPVPLDLFDIIVDKKGMKTKYSKESVRSVFKHDYRKEWSQENLGRQRDRYCLGVLKSCQRRDSVKLLCNEWD